VSPCPYCGAAARGGSACEHCGGRLDPLSRQATQNQMGPWFIRDPQRPFAPGCSYETLVALVRKGRVTTETVIRGPTTLQFWAHARRVPGVAHLLGICHSCQGEASPENVACSNCGASFSHEPDRQRLGLGSVHVLPSAGRAAASRSTGSPAAEPEARSGERGRSGVRLHTILVWLIVGLAVGVGLGGAVVFGPWWSGRGEEGSPVAQRTAPTGESEAAPASAEPGRGAARADPVESPGESDEPATMASGDGVGSPSAEEASAEESEIDEAVRRRFLERRAEQQRIRDVI